MNSVENNLKYKKKETHYEEKGNIKLFIMGRTCLPKQVWKNHFVRIKIYSLKLAYILGRHGSFDAILTALGIM